MLRKGRIGTFLILFMINFVNHVASAQDYIVSQGIQTKITISAKGVNRIAIENDRIAQVIGNEDEYFVESDSNLGQVFLTSALKTSSEISVRFLTEREKIIDAKLVVSAVDPQTIVFRYKGEEGKVLDTSGLDKFKPNSINSSSINTYEYKTSNFEREDSTNQVIDVIKLVRNIQNIKGADIVTLNCLNNNTDLKDLKFVRASSYDLKKYNAIRAVIQNKSKNHIGLNEEDFVGCMKNVTAIAFDKDTLGPKESANLYLVGSYGR